MKTYDQQQQSRGTHSHPMQQQQKKNGLQGAPFPQAAPPPVSQGATQVQDAADQQRRAALLRKGRNQSMFAGANTDTEQGQGKAGGQQLKGLLG